MYLRKLPWQLIICSNETDGIQAARKKKVVGQAEHCRRTQPLFKVILLLFFLLYFVCSVTTLSPDLFTFHNFYTRHEIACVNTFDMYFLKSRFESRPDRWVFSFYDFRQFLQYSTERLGLPQETPQHLHFSDLNFANFTRPPKPWAAK
jgi:hypothetical protein